MSKLISSLVFWALIPGTALAQIAPDSSLGAENSVVESSGNRDTINGGAIRDANLFHSFQEFNVEALREAYFANPDGIANIFSRVTGSNLSDIQGVLGVLGNANLYLINPNGILFGENARLDVNGSFLATTADSVLFENGFEFSAVNPDAPPLLTIDIPLGLRFRDNPGDITVRGTGNGVRLIDSEVVDTQEALRVDSDSTIGLMAGNLFFEDATIKTAGGRIEIGSVAGGEIELVEVADGFTIDYSEIENFSDISLSGTNSIDASGLGGGDIQVAGRNISITGISAIVSHTLGSSSGGDINVMATESLEINGLENDLGLASGIANRVYPEATADGGNINIETGSLKLNNRAFIRTSTLGQGDAGNININASDSVSLESQESRSEIASNVTIDAVGNGGDINVTTPSLTLGDGVSINSGTSGQGNGGNININARDSVSLASQGNTTKISSVVGRRAVGNGGDINVNTSLLTVTSEAYFDNTIYGQGNAGNIAINASEAVFDLQDSIYNGIYTYALFSGSGNGGNIEINTDSLTLDNGAEFLAGVVIGQGDGGNIEINTGSLTLNNEAELSAGISFFGQGNAGNVTINTTDSISLTNGSDIDVNALEGNAGNIEVNTASLILDDTRLSALNSGQGKGGNVTINATDDVSLTNGSDIFVTGSGGGSISIKARNLSLMSDSAFFSGVGIDLGFADAQSGDIVINLTEDLVVDGLDGESFTLIGNSNFGTGNEGNIDINARNITFRNGANLVSFNDGQRENRGKINLTATGDITFDGIKGFQRAGINNFVNEQAIGNIGEINITAQNLSLTNGAGITSLVTGTGKSGDINISANNIVVDGEDPNTNILSAIGSDVGGIGDTGKIVITTDNITLTNGGNITTTNSGQGNAGDLDITANNISIDGKGIELGSFSGFFSINAIGQGNAGDIHINTGSLSISNSGFVSSTNESEGDAGDITINALDTISVMGNSGISSPVLSNAVGSGGNIEINTPKFFLNFSTLATDSLGKGDSGNIAITTEQLILNNFSGISANISGEGDAGNINIKATNSLTLTEESTISASVRESATGDAGDTNIETQRLTLSEGSQISNSTFGKGNAGDLTIIATESIELRGIELGRSGLLATALGGDGNGGDLQIFTKDLIIADGAIITVSNFPTLEGLGEPGTGEPGSIKIEANSIRLENEGIIDAATQSPTGEGANINLKVIDDIILRDNSLISAQAINNADGGNLDIDARFIIAFPNQNNDIIASAEQGQGGKINITAEALFGIEERPLNPRTNDINASSQFGLEGSININTPTVDPTSGLLELTQDVVDPAKLIAPNVCTQTADSEFVDIGKGGLPQNPQDRLAEDFIEVGLVAPIITSSETTESTRARIEIKPKRTRKPPAQGWIFHDNGIVELVAYNPNQVGEQRTWDNHRGCQ